MDANLFTQNSFRVPAFADTTAANAVTTLDSAGKIINTYNVNGLWLRQNQPHKWSQIGSSSNPINDTVYVDAPLYAYFDSTGHQHIAIQQQDGPVGVCPVVWDSLLVFSVPPCNYVINGTFYTSPATTITLPPADPTYSRYDLFIVDTVPEATKITGTPAAIPTIPQVDPQSQIALTSGFLINPGDTVPNNATQKLIYDENAGTPTEWAFTTSGTITANANNTDNPKHKTKAIFVSSYTNNSKLNFLSASTDTFNTNNGQVLWGYVYFNGAFLNKLKFQFFNGSTAVSSALTINNTFGLNPNDSNRYQLFSIPLSAFTWTNTVFDKLVITHVGTDNSGAKGYYIDWINIQSGVMPIPSPIDYSNKADSAGTYKINDSTYITRTWVKGSSFPVGDTIHASSTGGGGGGSGTVTSISQGYGITNTPNPITTIGTVKSDTTAHATSTNTGYLSNIDWQAFHGKVDSVTKNTSQDSFYVWTNGNHVALKDSSGGVGGTNVNIGTGYRLAVLNTNNIKTLNPLFGILMDSTTASNTISLKVDTINAVTSKLRGDSLAAAIALKLNKTDTANKWVSNIYGKVGVDSIFFQIGSTQYAILDSAGGGSTIKQTYTSGATVTANNTTTWLIINPASIQSTLTITLAATPTDGQKIEISFGGTITSGNVVTTLTLLPNTGQTILSVSTPVTLEAGETIMYRYN